jgi:hypothetical protein
VGNTPLLLTRCAAAYFYILLHIKTFACKISFLPGEDAWHPLLNVISTTAGARFCLPRLVQAALTFPPGKLNAGGAIVLPSTTARVSDCPVA